MAISYKTPEQVERMRQAGRWVHEALRRCREACRPGATTAEIDAKADDVVAESGGVALFKNHPANSPDAPPFPASTCISVNDEVVHGIPSADRVVQDGDIVSIDFGLRLDGWCGDSATTVLVGDVKPETRRLCEATEHVLNIAIENIRPGRRWFEVARLMENYARKMRFGVVREFVGHGIGQSMHEAPNVPNFAGRDRRGDFELRPGLVLAVEPMCCLGTDSVRVLSDKWTVVTADRKPAAHYEHTIAVTDDGCDVLTDGRETA